MRFGRLPPTPEKRRATKPLAPVHVPVAEVFYDQLFPACFDQGEFGSCVSNATAETVMAYRYKRGHAGIAAWMSRRAIYSEALHEFYPNAIGDNGLEVMDGLNIAKSKGYVDEAAWPYPVPTDNNYLIMFEPVPANLWHPYEPAAIIDVPVDVESMKIGLYKHGPLVIGLTWANEWENVGTNGTLPAPQTAAGGHCVAIAGFSDTEQMFFVRNSWGPGWADHGYCWMSYAFVGSQFWPTEAYALEFPT